MSFKMKYEITQDLLPIGNTNGQKRRQGRLAKCDFGVVHDTGNKDSTDEGNIDWAIRTLNDGWSWAHAFIDNNSIRECIPCFIESDTIERACHVNAGATLDNKLYGDDANDIAIGAEICYFSDKEKTKEAYKRFIWFWAYVGYFHKWKERFGTVSGRLLGHFQLQPWNRTDPMNAFSTIGITWEQFLKDVDNEYEECLGDEDMEIKKIKQNIDFFGTIKEIEIDNIDGYSYFTADNLREFCDVIWDEEEKTIRFRMKGE